MFAGAVGSARGMCVSLRLAVAILKHEDISTGKRPGLHPELGMEGKGMLPSN